ncbi:hypothetical protein Taro_033049 [Colocasia esculenta]|uniref:Uncharacterized protein n=1 Tax=Colocasia esculenta TaxID=4460 RepID=A0A843VZ13_COLES|nr:hypothetical protein [Colocasia esculenta]
MASRQHQRQSFAWCLAPEGLSRERGCYHLPGTPILVRLRGSVWGDERTRVTDYGVEGKTVVRTAALSRFRSSLGWSGTPRTVGVLPGVGQPVLLLTALLFVAPEPPRVTRHGTVVRPDYGGYYCVTLCSCPHFDETWRIGLGSRVRLLSSGWVHVGRRIRGGSRRPRS